MPDVLRSVPTRQESTRSSRMGRLMEDIWFLERDLVSDGFDRALERLQAELPLQVHGYPSGKEVWTWIVPEKWTCDEAYVERLNGERILDQRVHPLHCMRYSMAFEGTVSREELLRHLSVSTTSPEAIPYAWATYRRDWGFCAPARFKESLADPSYRVVIRSRHEAGTLKVGEVVAPGSGEGEFVLCAHLDHPCMVNDDLSGVLVGMEVMRELLQRSNLRMTYRFLMTPETIGSVAWLSQHQDRIPRIRGGLFLEMLGTDCPHALQRSFQGDTELDRLWLAALRERDPDAWDGPYRRVIGNDERQFNAPGVRIPMLSLSRVFHPNTGKWPYPEYHTSADNPRFVSLQRMEESVQTVLALIDRWEENPYPVNLFRGEVFCTRYGMFVDFYQDPQGNRRLFDMIQLIDGSHSVHELAASADMPFSAVLRNLQQMEKHHLIYFSDAPVDPSDWETRRKNHP